MSDRGFAKYGSFKDAGGNEVRLVEASMSPLVHVHLICGKAEEYKEKVVCEMPLLNVRQAIKLIALLTRFVEHKLETSHDKALTVE